MTIRILTQRDAHGQILRCLLRDEELEKAAIVEVDPRSTFVSVARTLLVKHREPVVVMLDTNTTEPTAVLELVQTYESLVGAAAAGVPYKILRSIPDLESILFEDTDGKLLRTLFPSMPPAVVTALAWQKSKKALEYMFKEGGGPSNLGELLAKLTEEDKASLRRTHPIDQLITFIEECAAIAR